MIPQRIYLKGVLCYREEQELYLTDASIWMLSGPNGSGKSAVFDAVTFALFGYHRGGKANPRELINKDETGLAVEFDFLLDGELFRLRRTARKRGPGTRQVSRWIAPGEQGGTWEAVLNTDTDRGFDQWVHEHIGLTYESFTSSVLLLQGQAERVLSPRPSDRREILESIVDLNRYQQLHERVDDRRKQLKIQAETLAKQLRGIPEIRHSDLVSAQSELAVRERATHEAREGTERLQILKNHTEQKARLEADLLANRNSQRRAQELLTNADAIRTDWNRLQELRDVLPHLKSVSDQRCRFAVAEHTIADLTDKEEQLSRQITEHEALLAESWRRRQSIATQVTADEEQLQTVGVRLRELSELLGRSRACDQQHEELAALQQNLALLPQDAAESLDRAQRQHDELLAFSQVISPLARLRNGRDALRHAAVELNEELEAERVLMGKIRALTAECAETCRRLEAAAIARRQADRQATEIRTLRDQAARRVLDFNEVAGQTTCNYCGQMLTAAHVETEQARLATTLATLETQLRSATNSLTTADQHEQQILNCKKTVDELLIETRERLNENRQHVQTLRRDQQEYATTCNAIYDEELDRASRGRLVGERLAGERPADWLATTYPTPADLDEMQQKMARLSTVREALRLAKCTFETFTRLQDRAEFINESIAAQQANLRSDPTALRNENEQLTNVELNLKRRLSECRQQLERENKTADALTTQRNNAQQQLSAIRAELKGAQEQRCGAERLLADYRNGLPHDWQVRAESLIEADLRNLQTELTLLLEQGLETRHNALLQAQANVDSFGRTVVDLEHRCHELPAEACQPVSEIERLLTIAKAQQSACDKALQDVQLRADRLVQRQSLRRQLREEYLKVSREQSLYHILAELLGPRKLQRELVRRAEREIVDLANTMLDRVSGGQLELTLAGHDEHQDDGVDQTVFQLEARNRCTAAEPLGVAFLSGSQRFRVAVSLALGMGQYASARRRSIQSVIIDEGFGSLDREGRQVMIQELQNLRGHLERIVLVSHQEEFADAFPDGYRFELKNGATQIARFHR